jgi:protein associated with RNAse G/E
MITVNSRRFDGTIRKTWQCELLEQRDSLLIAIGKFDINIDHQDLGHIRKGTISHEYFWLDRWYNIFRFHEPTGELRNFYGNVCMPPEFKNGILDYVDLDIDVLVDPSFNVAVLDREDYESSAATFGYSTDIHAKVDSAVNELLEVFSRRHMPGLPELFATSDAVARECG